MNVQAEQYKEMPTYAVLQYPILSWFLQASLYDVYSGAAVFPAPAVAGNEYNIVLPTFRSEAKLYKISWNIQLVAQVIATVAPISDTVIRLDPQFIQPNPNSFLIDNIPYNKIFYPNIPFVQMTNQLSNIRLADLVAAFCAPINNLAPNADFVPDKVGTPNAITMYMKPIIYASF